MRPARGAAAEIANTSAAQRDFAGRRRIRMFIGKIIACSRYDIIGSSSRPGIIGPMRTPLIPLILLLGLLAGCAGQSTVKPVEALDEQTGVTVGALKNPIELRHERTKRDALVSGKRPSFAYLGPVEWNRSGDFSYGLWIHVSPGNERQPGDIRTPRCPHPDSRRRAAGPVADARRPSSGTIRTGRSSPGAKPPTSTSRSTTLKRMAASRKLELDVRAVDGSIVSFAPTLDTHAALTQYLHDRGITGD